MRNVFLGGRSVPSSVSTRCRREAVEFSVPHNEPRAIKDNDRLKVHEGTPGLPKARDLTCHD